MMSAFRHSLVARGASPESEPARVQGSGRTPRDRQSVKVSFVNSIFYQRDAISLVMSDQIRALTEAPGRPYDIRIFVGGTNFDDARISIVQNLGDVLRSRHFRESQLAVFQWGVYYDLYDIVFVALSQQRLMTYFHNITPSLLFTDCYGRALAERGEKQVDNLFFSDFVLCNSVFSMNNLIDRGIPRERMDVLYPVHVIPAGSSVRRRETGAAQLLYVGRFVRQKGARELLLAAAEARRAGVAPFQIRMVGAARYSDKHYIDELKSLIASEGLDDRVSFLGELSDSALGTEFARAHALVMPSYHEGFCLPVVEALSAGCYVIAFDGGNLPYLVGDLGTVVAAGDVGALSAALVDFTNRVAEPTATRRYRTTSGELSVKAYEAEAKRYACRYTSYEAFRDKFVMAVERLLTAPVDPARLSISPYSASVVCGDAKTSCPEPAAETLNDRLARLERSFADRRKIMSAAQNVIEMQRFGPQSQAALPIR